MKHIKNINEMFYLGGSEIKSDDENLKNVFSLRNYKTTKEIDFEYYIELGFKHIAEECVKYNITPNKEVMNSMVENIKDFSENNFLYYDPEMINEEDQLNYIIEDFFYELKRIQPEEYEKYEIKLKTTDFNL